MPVIMSEIPAFISSLLEKFWTDDQAASRRTDPLTGRKKGTAGSCLEHDRGWRQELAHSAEKRCVGVENANSSINRRIDRRVPGGGRDRIAIEWSRARQREKRARVSGPPDSLHCFVFKCLDLANDWWSAYSRSLPFAFVRGSIRSRFDRALRTTSAHNKSVNTSGAERTSPIFFNTVAACAAPKKPAWLHL